MLHPAAIGCRQSTGPTFGALRHELAATLLSVLSQAHPTVPVAAQLCADVAGVTAADKAVHTALGSKYGSWQQQRILAWVTACRVALHATQVGVMSAEGNKANDCG
jgi:hypothetical protein